MEKKSSVRLPVYRQYISDRVSGYSYVPRSQRGQDGDAEDVQDGSSDPTQQPEPHHDEDGDFSDDPTDCQNRPPHFLCYLPPCVRRFPGFLEQNAVCECAGRFGLSMFKRHHIRRRRLFFIGFFFNFCALALMVVSCMAFTRNHRLLTHTSFSRGEATGVNVTWSDPIFFDVGFRAVAVTDPIGSFGGNAVYLFDTICDESDAILLKDSLCGDCRQSSEAFVVSCLFNLFIVLRNMFSDITRMYPRYDSNCSSFYGSLMATFSVFLGIYTLWIYQRRCHNNIQETREYLPEDLAEGEEVLPDLDVLQVEIKFVWENGPGLTCLGIATFLRTVDMICNYIVPTPSITRSREEQEEYELEFGEKVTSTKNDGLDIENDESEQLKSTDRMSTLTTQQNKIDVNETSDNDNIDDEVEAELEATTSIPFEEEQKSK